MNAINPTFGRAEDSNVDQQKYTPRAVLTEPGLLHSDVDAIQSYFDAAMEDAAPAPLPFSRVPFRCR